MCVPSWFRQVSSLFIRCSFVVPRNLCGNCDARLHMPFRTRSRIRNGFLWSAGKLKLCRLWSFESKEDLIQENQILRLLKIIRQTISCFMMFLTANPQRIWQAPKDCTRAPNDQSSYKPLMWQLVREKALIREHPMRLSNEPFEYTPRSCKRERKCAFGV